MEVIILRGLPGSGKSTYTNVYSETPGKRVIVVSADDYFIGSDGVYRYNASKIGEAHKKCLRTFLDIIQTNANSIYGSIDVLFVDNTNTTGIEIAPYVAIAQGYGLQVKVVEIESSLSDEELGIRNLHGVPKEIITRMRANMEESLPPWWIIEKVLV